MPISSLIVEVGDAEVANVESAINAIDGAQVSKVEDKKLVVLTDTTDNQRDREIWNEIEGTPGVITVSLIYHNFEDLEDVTQ